MKTKRQSHQGRSTALAIAATIIASLPLVRAQQPDAYKLDYETSYDLSAGSWHKPLPSESHVMPDGSIIVAADAAAKFFRLNFQPMDFEDAEMPQILVTDLPPHTVEYAEDHLQWVSSMLSGDGEGEADVSWAGARLGPVAMKVYEASCMDGESPAFIEFKVVAGEEPVGRTARFLEGTGRVKQSDLGYILVSLHDGDSPVPAFSQEGSTPCEKILRCVVGGRTDVKIMRYGPSFSAVESASGELLANMGTEPFKLPADLFLEDGSYGDEFDTRTSDSLPAEGYGGPDARLEAYRTYAEFKQDYCNNPAYVELRERKRQAVAAEWAVLRGEALPEPTVVRVRPGESVQLLGGRAITKYFLDDDLERDRPFVRLEEDGRGGVQVYGDFEGFAHLTAETADGLLHKIYVEVQAETTPPDPEFVEGWQDAEVWVAGEGYSDQPRYYQMTDSRWCPKVGCGPVAWAILCAWWDRHGVPATFYDSDVWTMLTSDAPKEMIGNHGKLRPVLNALHDYCDVICFGEFSEQGASWPADMAEAGPAYLWLPKTLGHLGYKYVWAWDLMDPNWNQPSSRIRFANKSGKPAIIGLGWMWHYAVSYAYLERQYKVTADGPPILLKQYFRCNEGWGKDHGEWYSGGDTFLGAYIKPWQS